MVGLGISEPSTVCPGKRHWNWFSFDYFPFLFDSWFPSTTRCGWGLFSLRFPISFPNKPYIPTFPTYPNLLPQRKTIEEKNITVTSSTEVQNEKGNVEDAWTTTSATFPFLICSTSSPNTFNKQNKRMCVYYPAIWKILSAL